MRAGIYLSLALAVVVSHQSWADANGAREVATRRLVLLIEQRGRLGSVDATKLATATLGDPILTYGASSVSDTTFFAYERAEAAEILHYVPYRTFCFPVMVDGSVCASINVAEVDGEYRVVGGYLQEFAKLVARFSRLKQQLQLPESQRLSILDTGVAGYFYVVEDGETVYRMAPADKYAMTRFGVTGAVGDPSTFSEPQHFVAEISRSISDARRYRNVGSQPTDEPRR